MAEESILSDDFLRQLINVGETDLLVVVPTHNQAKTIAEVVQAVRLGLLRSFPRERAVLLIADNGSRDDTVQLALQAVRALPPEAALHSLRTFNTVVANYGSNGDSASYLKLVLAATDLLRAKASAVISPYGGIDPQWIGNLLTPVYRSGFDLVAPLYRRHKFEGLLVRILLYPMLRAVWGKRIHEPFSTEFSLSNRIGTELFAKDEILQSKSGDIGEELLLTLFAVRYGYNICETFLGAKQEPDKATDLVAAIREAVGTLFCFLENTPEQWQAINSSEPIPVQSGAAEITCEPLRIQPHRMHAMFRSGVGDLRQILESVLLPETLTALSDVASLQREDFRFPDELWVRIVYEFAASYHRSVISRDHILQALVPIYRGKAYDFLTTNRQADSQQVDTRIESLCAEFERLKPYLLQLWNRKEGGTQ